MALNMESIHVMEEKLDRLEQMLQGNHELFNSENMYEFSSERESFRKKIAQSQQESRMLQIGIIGAVKAGKSSFLNALLFDGEEILPKAATPMTAALTKISYSQEPGTHAVIHFYRPEDWQQIEELAEQYDQKLDEEYTAYETRIREAWAKIDNYNATKRDIISEKPKEKPPLLTKDEFEKKKFRRSVSENLASAKELIAMAENGGALGKLGTSETVSGSLEEYIGAKGAYTAIVNYVELQIHDERLKDFVIVDTPGLNDPIVSRGNITKKFLAECDVALLLSPTGQFMDVETMNLMANSLPNAGVNEIIVVGSKLDAGILDYSKSDSVEKAYRVSLRNYRTQFENNRTALRSTNPISAKKLEKVQLAFISSTFYAIAQKRKRKGVLDDHEEKILGEFRRRFGDFNEQDVSKMSGINDIAKLLNGVIERKEEIIHTKNDTLLNTFRHNIFRILNIIETDAVSAKDKLENSQENEVKVHYDSLIELFRRSRIKLASVFDIASSEAEKSCFSTKAHIEKEIKNYTKITIKSETHTEQRVRHGGIFGLKKEYYTIEVTVRKAEVSEVCANLHGYIGKCKEIIGQDFELLVDKDQMSRRVKNVVIETMHKAGGNYSEDDVLLPLNATLAKIEIPKVDISENEYIDMVNSAFRDGVAENEEIHKLNALQMDILTEVFSDISESLERCVSEIRTILQKQSDSFTDVIMNKLENEQERIEKQMKEKEMYIARYQEFLKLLSKHRQELNQ